MPDSVVARVADRLDIQPEQTDRVLRTLAQLIKKQSARDGRVRVPGLGVFQQTLDTLSFEPDTTLSEAINHRFLGLEPLPLSHTLEVAELVPEGPPEESPALPLVPPLSEYVEDEHATEAPEAMAASEAIPMEEDAVDEAPWAQEEAVEAMPDGAADVVAEAVVEEEAPLAEAAPAEEAHVDERPEGEPDAEAEGIADAVPEAEEEATAEGDSVDEAPHAEDTPGEAAGAEGDGVDEAPLAEDTPGDVAEAVEEAVEEKAVEEEAAEEDGIHEEAVDEMQPAAEYPIAADAEETDVAGSLYAPPPIPLDYDDPDVSEAAAYAAVQEEPQPADEDPYSEWAPGGAGRSRDDLGDLPLEADREEPVAEETTAPVLDVPAEETASQEGEEAVAPPTTDHPPTPPPARKRPAPAPPRRRSALPWILLVTAVIVISATLYFLVGPPSKTMSDTPPIAATETPPPAAADTALPADTTDEAPTDTTAAPTAADVPPTTPPVATPTAPTTPPASRIDLARGGYTLVVGSSTQQAVAETQAERVRQRLSALALPVDVLSGTSNGATRYRVVVGQVPTVDEAVALRDRHAALLPDGTWPTNIARITTDS